MNITERLRTAMRAAGRGDLADALVGVEIREGRATESGIQLAGSMAIYCRARSRAEAAEKSIIIFHDIDNLCKELGIIEMASRGKLELHFVPLHGGPPVFN